jgi:hypothetical protein
MLWCDVDLTTIIPSPGCRDECTSVLIFDVDMRSRQDETSCSRRRSAAFSVSDAPAPATGGMRSASSSGCSRRVRDHLPAWQRPLTALLRALPRRAIASTLIRPPLRALGGPGCLPSSLGSLPLRASPAWSLRCAGHPARASASAPRQLAQAPPASSARRRC